MPIVPGTSSQDQQQEYDRQPASVLPSPEPAPAPAPPMNQAPEAPVIPEQQSNVSNLFPDENINPGELLKHRAAAAATKPDEAARIFKVAYRTGLPEEFVQKNLDDLEAHVNDDGFSSINFIKKNPKYAGWLTANPNNYAMVKDDFQTGSKLEDAINEYTMMDSAQDALMVGLANIGSGVAKTPGLLYNVAALPQNIAANLLDEPSLRTQAPDWLINNDLSKFYDEQRNFYSSKNKDLQGSIIELYRAGEYEKAGRTLFANVVVNMPNTVAIALSGPAYGLGFAAATTAANKNAENQAAGINPEIGTLNAASTGSLEAVFEKFGTLNIIEEMGKALTKNVGKQGWKEIVKSYSKEIAASVMREGSTEAGTELSQRLTDYYTGVNTEQTPGEIIKSTLEAGLIGGVSGGTTTSALGIGMARFQHKAKIQADLQKNFYLSLNESAESSKAKELLPPKYREMVEHITKDGPVENMYIPQDKFMELFQSYDGGAAGAIKDLGVEAEFNTAEETGGLVKVSTAAWAEKMAGTEFYNKAADHVTFNPDKPTPFEVNELIEVTKKADADNAQSSESFDPLTWEPQTAKDGMTVEQQVMKKLMDSGMSEFKARKNAVIFRVLETLAKRSGMTAQELFSKYNLNITNQAAQLPTQYTGDQLNKPTLKETYGPMIDAIRKGNPEPKPKGKSLFEFVRSKGGIKLDDVFSGEMKNLPKSLRNKNGLDLDKMREAAAEAGYLGSEDSSMNTTVGDFLELLDAESRGNKIYALEDQNDIGERIALREQAKQFESALKAAGVDLRAASNEQIIRMIESGAIDLSSQAPATGDFDFSLLQSAGRNALTASNDDLVRANRMTADGISPEQIFKETGWYLGKDQRWRFEISDKEASMKPVKIKSGAEYLLGDILDHKELFAAYPELKNIKVKLGLSQGSTLGSWNKRDNVINLNVQKLAPGFEKEHIELNAIKDTAEYEKFKEAYFNARYKSQKDSAWKDFFATEQGARYKELSKILDNQKKKTPTNFSEVELSTMLHEIQHAIQSVEGFAPGAGAGRSLVSKRNYFNTLGEVEARDTQKRQDLSNKERRDLLPDVSTWKTPVIGWGSVIKEAPIDESIKTVIGEQMSLFQSKQNQVVKRGSILFDRQGNFNIEFLKDADASTFLHESAHFFFEVMADLAKNPNSPQQIKNDFAALMKFIGAEELPDPNTEKGSKQLEMIAESFEQYLLEGKSPSIELREAFETFRSWLVSVYLSIHNFLLRNPNAKLNDEVRGVFDRMLATDEEISRAMDEFNATPLFINTDGVMPKTESEKYQTVIHKERREAENKARAVAMFNLRKAQLEHRKERENQIREEVSKEVYNSEDQLIYTMIKDSTFNGELIKGGKDSLKIDKKSAKNMLDPSVFDKLPKGIFGPEGSHPDFVARFTTGGSGYDLLAMLASMENAKDKIERLVQEQLNQEFPDPTVDASFADEAAKAIHNEFSTERRLFELKTLARLSIGSVKGMTKRFAARPMRTVEQFKNRAELTIGTMSLRDIKPALYKRSEIKYAKESVQHFLNGDFEKAVEAKQLEIYNHELYKVATSVNDEIGKSIEKFNKVFQSDEKLAKTRDINYVNVARAILSEFKIGKADKTATDYLKSIEAYETEDFYNAMKGLVDDATTNAKDFRDVSFNEFVGLRNAFDALWSLAKTTNQITIEGKKVNREDAQNEMIAQLDEHKKNKGLAKTSEDGFIRAVGEKEQRKSLYLTAKAHLRRVESWVDYMDLGRHDGPFRKYIWNPISDGVTQYRLKKIETVDAFAKLIENHIKGFTEEEIRAPELVGFKDENGNPSPYAFKNKAELLGALLHTGNLSNKRKLLVGNGWGSLDENGNLDTKAWDNFIDRMIKEEKLTKADYDFIQATWDLMEGLKKDAQKAHKEIYGYHFSEVTSNEFVTPFGTYKGGYAPATVDRLRVENTRQERNALEAGITEANMFPAQINGFTKSRVENYTAPLSMDLRLVPMHVDQVLRFSHITPRMREVYRMLSDKTFRGILNDHDSAVIKEMLVPWLDRSVRQSVVTPSTSRVADQMFRKLRSRVGASTMFLNVVNTMQQYTGLSVAAAKVAPKYLRNSVFSFARDSKGMAAEATLKSDFMKTKVTLQTAESLKGIDEILKKPTATDTVKDFFQKNAYVLQGMAQSQVDLIVWHGAYTEAIESKGVTEKEAVRIADSAVRQTQGTFAPEDVSRFETGTPVWRMFTMFSSYFNMLANLLGTEAGKIIQSEIGISKKALQGLWLYSTAFMVPAVVSGLIVQIMSGKGLDADDDDEYLDDFMKLFFGEQFKTATGLVPLVGQFASSAANRFNENPMDDRLSLSPAFISIESSAGVLFDIYKAYDKEQISKPLVRDSLTLLSLLSGVPLTPIAKPITYMMDVESGKANPENPLEVTRGLITGRPGK